MRAVASDDLSAIRSVLEQQDDLQLGIVFGSLARGQATGAESDADVAVHAGAPLGLERREALIRSLATAVGRPIDLIDLSCAGVVVLRSVLLQGVTLVERDASLRPELLSRMLTDTEDFLPLLQRLWRERRLRWTT